MSDVAHVNVNSRNFAFIRESFALIREKYNFFPTKMSSMGFRNKARGTCTYKLLVGCSMLWCVIDTSNGKMNITYIPSKISPQFEKHNLNLNPFQKCAMIL